jgi:cytochrome c-type biogenesis protein CcmH/NrfG
MLALPPLSACVGFDPAAVPPDVLPYSSAEMEARALRAWRQLQTDPADTTARLELGAALVESGHAPQAARVLEPALRSGIEPVRVRLVLAAALRRGTRADLDRAVQLLEEASRLAPEDTAVRTSLACAYAQQGRDQRAIASEEQVLASIRAPQERLRIHLSLIVLYDRAGDSVRADAHQAAARTIDPRVDREMAHGAFQKMVYPSPHTWAYDSLDGIHPGEDERMQRARKLIDEGTQ